MSFWAMSKFSTAGRRARPFAAFFLWVCQRQAFVFERHVTATSFRRVYANFLDQEIGRAKRLASMAAKSF
jgi:hypothetical protein